MKGIKQNGGRTQKKGGWGITEEAPSCKMLTPLLAFRWLFSSFELSCVVQL
jgi:hypothetical protein